MQRIIIAIKDTLADDITGNLIIVNHPAVGVRLFGDVCQDKNTNVARHIEDHELVQLGILQSDLHITDAYEVIITGKQWLAAQQGDNAQ